LNADPRIWDNTFRLRYAVLPMRLAYALASLAILCCLRLASAQAPSDREAALRMPLSPGSVALLIEHASDPAVKQRLAEALQHASPDVRAAAARVVFVAAVTSLLPEVASALGRENYEDPAIEQVRVLSGFGGSRYDQTILDAFARLGVSAPRAAAAFAFVRGEAALGALPAVRRADASSSALVPFLSAARLDVPALTRLLESADREADAKIAEASIRAATRLGRSLGDGILASVLQKFQDEDVRLAVFDHVLDLWDGERQLEKSLKDALVQAASAHDDHGDDETFLLKELIARAGGRPPNRTSRLTTILESPTWLALDGGAVRHLLTSDERERVAQRFPRGPRSVANPNRRTQPTMQSVDRYPNRFLSDLLVVSGCTARKARDLIGIATVTLRRDGRAERVSIAPEGLSDPACARAARAALIAHVTDWSDDEIGQRIILLPMSPGFIQCRETMVTDAAVPRFVRPGNAPKKIQDVRPVYPPSAINDRVQGVVRVKATIASTGCVRDAYVTGSEDPRLDLSALRAIIGWRYTPYSIGGVPVSVTVDVTAQFILN
jgi:TonB family protein